jgi:PIN domain nuclease of toxin-antitoxin system
MEWKIMLYLDTHAVVWLYEGDMNFFSKKAIQLLEKNQLIISAMVRLEIQYLYEIKRCTKKSEEIIHTLQQQIYLAICPLTFNEIAEKALHISWTRDPFDRLIIANAMVNHQQLLTKDTQIHKHYKKAVW